MKTSLTKSNFKFLPSGYGCYRVTYTSNSGRVVISSRITDMCLIDCTKNSDNPRLKDLVSLRSAIRYNS